MQENTPKALHTMLWNCINVLRSKMDANEYKNYLLSLVFYKYLSDSMLFNIYIDMYKKEPSNLQEAQEKYEEFYDNEQDKKIFLEKNKHKFIMIIKPELTFTNIMKNVYSDKFQLKYLQQGLQNVENTNELFKNIFEDLDLESKKLGATKEQKNKIIAELLKKIDAINIIEHKGDVLGDAYEYLLNQFSSEAGKKSGEFYTPQAVSKILSKIVFLGREDKENFTIYDPTMGSGSLLLNAQKCSNKPNKVHYFGQELNTSTYRLARMNMILRGIDISKQHLLNVDTLAPLTSPDTIGPFDAVVMNPPFSANWSAEKSYLEDLRFLEYKALAPKSRADFSFLLHGLYYLKKDGVMTIVLPHGVLFRGNPEEKIRKKLIDINVIDTIIGLPESIFFSTSIETAIIVLKKNRKQKDILFIDASKQFEKHRSQNVITDKHINKILETYKNREEKEKYSHIASYHEISENNYNLNIARYVDTFEEEPEIPLKDLADEMQSIETEIKALEKQLFHMFNELHGTTQEAEDELQYFINKLASIHKC